jgi:hypothetical protein
VRVVAAALRELAHGERDGDMSAADREAIETALATRYRGTLADPTIYEPQRFLALSPADRARADDILRRRAAGDPGAAEAQPAVRRLVDRTLHSDPPPLAVLAVVLFYGTLVFIAVLALIFALVCRGVILRLIGFEIVRGRGQPASRLRVLARTAITWSPLLLPAAVSTVVGGIASAPYGLVVVMTVSLLILLGGAILAILHPARGLQDRLAGTWIVPR